MRAMTDDILDANEIEVTFGARKSLFGENRSVKVLNGVSVRIGRGETEIDLPTLVKRADQALYRAKRDGRDRVSV